jgi:hypothetical protein
MAIARLRAANPKLSFHQAWNEARRTSPQLFGNPPRGEDMEIQLNRAQFTPSPEQVSERTALVAKIQNRNPKLLFTEVWQEAKRQRRDLFGRS